MAIKNTQCKYLISLFHFRGVTLIKLIKELTNKEKHAGSVGKNSEEARDQEVIMKPERVFKS